MQGFTEVIAERARRNHPADSYVVKGSTPVLSFGNPTTARIATIGINPSCDEFEQSNRVLFSDSKRRLEDFQSLKIQSAEEIDDELAERIHSACLNYFNRRPYGWFNQLNRRVNSLFNCNYQDGTAVHLDLVQWATNPVWGRIPSKTTQSSLLSTDADFLRYQLSTSTSIEMVYLSGDQVFNQLNSVGIISAEIAQSYSFIGTNGTKSSYNFYAGRTFNGIPALGWSRVMPGHYVPKGAMEDVFGKLSQFLKSTKI
jgi:hypothetical protein